MIDVSIVIVCMKNLDNLYPCLDSIKTYTNVSYEIIVVAYLFSEENLVKLKKDYPWVGIVESNEIRGFSENNNLGLNKAVGSYCFVLNDDTYIKSPVIDDLIFAIKKLPENVAVISPNIIYPDGSPQCCGRPPIDWITFILSLFKINLKKKSELYINQKGIFKSYNILGAAFIIKTTLFKKIGFFDEQFFYCPEDIAVSTTLNKLGYECYVNANVFLYHIGGGTTWSKIMGATEPAGKKGDLLFYSDNSQLKYLLISTSIFISSLLFFFIYKSISLVHKKEYFEIKGQAKLNTCKTIFKTITPKDIFIQFYSNLN